MMKKAHLLLSCVFLLLLWSVSLAAASKEYIRTQVLMGTVPVTITVTGDYSTYAVDAAFDECRRVEGLVSRWIPTSDVSKLNREGSRHAVHVSPETLSMIRHAVKISVMTDGAFDITYPSPTGDFHDIEILVPERTIRFKKKEMKIDPDGIAKGFLVDRMVEILKGHGVTNAMVNAGGDLRVLGRGPDGSWKVKIQQPGKARGAVFATRSVATGAVASAGNYEQGPHLFDPKTHQPISWKGISGVTVFAPDAATANAVATAIWVKGPVDGRALIERLKENSIDAIIIP